MRCCNRMPPWEPLQQLLTFIVTKQIYTSCYNNIKVFVAIDNS